MIRPHLLALPLVLLCGPGLAEILPFSPGEVVNVDIWGQPDMSGERQIDEAGRIALPAVGRIEAAGKDPEALETAIADRLSEAGFEEGAIVTVTVVRRLDVYIDGAVGTPGAHPWRPGLTIDQLLALAGGRILVTSDELGPALQALRAIEYAAGLDLRLKTLRLIEARLLAERAFVSRAFGPAPEPDLDPLSLFVVPAAAERDAALSDLVQTQLALIASRAERDRKSLAALQTRLAIQEERLKALDARETGLAEVETLMRDRLEAVKALGEKGLTARDVIVEVTQAYADTVSEQLNVAAAQAETRVAIAELQQALARFADDLVQRIDEDLSATLVEIGDIETRLDPALRAAALSQGYEGAGLARAGGAGPGQAGRPGSSAGAVDPVTILRNTVAGQDIILATPGFTLLPGDTVVVPFAGQE